MLLLMNQFQVGYIIDGLIADILQAKKENNPLWSLVTYLSFCDYDSSFIKKDETKTAISEVDSLILVVNNMICRGLPTKMSVYLQDIFTKKFAHFLQSKTIKDGSIKYAFTEGFSFSEIEMALHIIEPRLTLAKMKKANIGFDEKSPKEKDFLFSSGLPEYLIQCFETQRPLESILHFAVSDKEKAKKKLNKVPQDFRTQRVDFSIEFPFEENGVKGLVVEIDGGQHISQRILDAVRDDAVAQIGWNHSLRIPTNLFPLHRGHEKIQEVLAITHHSYCKKIKENYENEVFSENRLDALELALSPFAIARIQKALIEYFIVQKIDFQLDNEIKILVIEQDVPCAYWAVEDLKQIFENLFCLEGKNKKFPNIDLTVVNTPEFKNAKLNENATVYTQFTANQEFDLLIDVAVLQRKGFSLWDYQINAKNYITLRSAHSPKTKRILYTGDLVTYASLLQEEVTKLSEYIYDLEKVRALTRLMQNIFRKQGFRLGQIDILNKGLQLKNVLGLLPTGGGKSLTYQMAALLQPGLTIVIDPIKSLMKDQYDGLIKAGIDSCLYINSSLKGMDREMANEKLENGEALFAFVSPERLLIPSFRDLLKKRDFYFAYCVIDEAHCVSEWGHDFRTSYLRLGENVREYCKTKNTKEIPFFGLTATASFDVLADVQRELDIESDAIIRYESLKRENLHFLVKEIECTPFPTPNPPLDATTIWTAKNGVAAAKQAKVKELLTEILNETGNDTLIFFPHRRGKWGVVEGEGNLGQVKNDFPMEDIGYFVGSGDDNSDGVNTTNDDDIMMKNQENFINPNHQMRLMLATKAFGMGIDKNNIRNTIHFNMPNAIESFVQESGRAGRDGKNSNCYLLFNNQHIRAKEYKENIVDGKTIGEWKEVFSAADATKQSPDKYNTIDTQLNRDFFKNNFKGKVKETFILEELLTEITYPTETAKTKISGFIEEELGLEASINFSTNSQFPNHLFVNQSFGVGYGHIRIDTLQINPIATHFDIATSTKVLETVKEWIIQNCPVGVDRKTWIETSDFTKPNHVGIATLFSKMEEREIKTLAVHFQNDKIRRLKELILEKGIVDVLEAVVYDAAKYANNIDDFIKNFANTLAKYQGVAPQDKAAFKVYVHNTLNPYKNSIDNLFRKIRMEQDTFKAIYRLTILGIVTDYTIDYNAKVVNLTICKQTDETYKENLRKYVARYKAVETAKEVYETIDSDKYKGTTLIRKCLGYIRDFVYDEIAVRRYAQIDVMRKACLEGLRGKKLTHKEIAEKVWEKANLEKEDFEKSESMKEFIDIYFNSKYANDWETPNLTEKGDNVKNRAEEFELVRKYIGIVGDAVDNWKHLRGACLRLMIEDSGNAVLKILNAYAVLLLDFVDESYRTNALKDFGSAIFQIYAKKKLTSSEIDEYIQFFADNLYKQNKDLQKYITQIELMKFVHQVFLEKHLLWLQSFNQHILSGYGGH